MDSVTNQSLGMLLERHVSKSLNRAAAAALTVAFETRKADHLSRGEQVTDDQVKQEIFKIFNEMLGVTEPDVAMAQARQAARPAQKP